MQGERITLCQPFLFLKIFRDESEEFVVINVHQTGFSYFQFLESLKRMSIGEIHSKYFFVFCVCVFISVMELQRSFFCLGIIADSISAKLKEAGNYSCQRGLCRWTPPPLLMWSASGEPASRHKGSVRAETYDLSEIMNRSRLSKISNKLWEWVDMIRDGMQ